VSQVQVEALEKMLQSSQICCPAVNAADCQLLPPLLEPAGRKGDMHGVPEQQ
jgi:hypothetical protein